MIKNDLPEKIPHNPTGGEILGKSLIGLIVGIMMAFLIFVILLIIGEMIQSALINKTNGLMNTTNPLISLIFMIIAFIGTFIGTILLAGSYNLFFPDKYYDIKKMFSFILLCNVFVFLMLAGLFIAFYNNIDTLFLILAFNILFGVFISMVTVEFISNVNYSGVHLLGSSIGLTLSILIFAIIYKIMRFGSASANTAHILITVPAILSYLIIPLGHAIFEKVYYKFYEMGNNFLYIPSLDEILVDAEEVEENVVDMNIK